ncbi:MAG: hypothetical protein KatS3mg061_0684 [Dehalococcoidia bacterium]|nr:MAG: hypothetical protein KatS3mg061_0684 [Dehalococcoidia bacterium]
MSWWRPLTLMLVAVTLVPLSLLTAERAHGAPPRDFAVLNGYFYSQANGDEQSPYGFTISDNGGDLFYSEFRRYGGVAVLGYPISRRFLLDGFPSQAFQKGILQWRKNEGRAVFVNVFDKLSEAGYDDWLRTVRLVPNKTIPEEAKGVPFEQIIVARQAVLNDNPQIRAAYFAVRDPILQYGLPTSRIEDLGPVLVVRLQRAVIQLWKTDQPWAKAGQVTIANGGDVFKEAGLIPGSAGTPHPAPGYENEGPAPVLKAPVAPPQPAQRAVAAPPPASTPQANAAASTTQIVRQIDPRKRTQPAYLQEVPNADFIIIKLHQRTACENAWLGIGFLEAQDKNGNPLDKVTIVTQSGETVVRHVTGVKGPGKVEAYFYRGNWTAWVEKDENGNPVTSDRAVNMDTMIFAQTPEEQAERYCKGVEAITTGHYSYDVVFRKMK